MKKKIKENKLKKSLIVYTKPQIFQNLKINKILNKIIECVNSGNIIKQEYIDIINELAVSEQNIIRQKLPNISDQATESLAWHLVKDRKILNDEIPVLDYLERRGNTTGTEEGADLVANGRTKIEVKSTSSKTGFTSASLNNKNVHAALFCDFYEHLKKGSEYIKIYALKDPQSFKKKIIETTGEEKLSMIKEVELAKKYGVCEEIQVHLGEYLINKTPCNIFRIKFDIL